MIAFEGTTLPHPVASAIAERGYAGVTLFRHANVESPRQVRELTAAIQAAAPADVRPLLIATDQETGQLSALDGTTAFAGAMALGAVGDEALAEQVAAAIGREMSALGVNVDYAPVCDLATAPENAAMGIRSFGDDPQAAARLVAATVRGLQSEGVAATAKHFPGLGGAVVDTHHELAVVQGAREDFERGEFVAFRAALDAGARLVMAAHIAVPGLTGDETLPASLSRAVLERLLRDELGFTGLTITDALDMHALAQGAAQTVEVIAALRAGEDLLLATADQELVDRVDQAARHAERRGLLDRGASTASVQRVEKVREWLARFEQAPLDVVGCSEHRTLARELAERSITLVRNDAGLLPLRLAAGARIAAVQPQPADLTPADTSSYVLPTMGEAIRRRWPHTDDVITPAEPSDAEVRALSERLAEYDVVVVGTSAAHLRPAHAGLGRAAIASGKPTVTVALRTPWDLLAYPAAQTHVCTYSILEPSMDAVASVLFGDIAPTGRLPVRVGDLHERGHGLPRWH